MQKYKNKKSRRNYSDGHHFSFLIFNFSLGFHVRLQGNMYPRSFVNQLRVRQVVSDVGQPAWVHRDVNSSTFRVVAVLGTAHGLVEGLTAEAGVDGDGLVEVVSEGLQDLGAQTHEVVHFDRVNAVLYLFLLSGLAVKHLFEGKVR